MASTSAISATTDGSLKTSGAACSAGTSMVPRDNAGAAGVLQCDITDPPSVSI
jgi:hypothetical protein